MIAHIVLFRPKAGLSQDQLRSFARSIKATIEGSEGLRRGTVGRAVAINAGYARHLDNSTYPFAAVLEFESADALVKYLVKPAHQTLGRLFWEYCDGTVVTEFESEELGNVDADWFLM
ncbi:MAG TPA: Dabb family protein [Vicinamibacterales bacterium]|nr:Dabb family protein [Vicinamibacterales bacterium]